MFTPVPSSPPQGSALGATVGPQLFAEARSRKQWPGFVVEALLLDLQELQHIIHRAYSVLAEAGIGDLPEAVLEATDILAGGETNRKGDNDDGYGA